jgi:hypothetical protein
MGDTFWEIMATIAGEKLDEVVGEVGTMTRITHLGDSREVAVG